jgi:DNA-binding NtrC family response regulator
VTETAIAIAPRGPTEALAALVERLKTNGIRVTVTDELRVAAQLALQTPETPPCILLDLEKTGGEIEDRRAAEDVIRRAAAAIPHTLPIAITGRTDAALFVACIRAGAGDVLDVQLEGTANAPAIVQRVWARQRDAARMATRVDALRAMIEDLLKDLIRTERRSIALEEKLARAERASSEIPVIGDARSSAILIVEHDRAIADLLADRLEAAGVTTYLFGTGEDAVREAARLLGSGAGFDLAVVAAQLPGCDGLATVGGLRELLPGLPAFLMTSVSDADLAARAADLGVVGFVHKPLPDAGEVVARLAQLAEESLQRTREHTYLERIKARHERVLARYRSLPRDT